MISIDTSTTLLDFSQYNIDEEKIVVIDNLFPNWFISYVHRQIMDSSGWRFGHYTESRNPEKEIPAFSQKIFPDPLSPISNDSLFPMIYHAVTHSMIDNPEIGEILINGQQYYHNTIFHQDCKDNGITMLYYVNANAKEEWGGETHIKVPTSSKDSITNSDDIIKVAPRPGRICLFLGKLMHKGESFNSKTNTLRATIAYKIGRDG